MSKKDLNSKQKVAVIGAGTMGRGIAQVAAQHAHPVTLCDVNAAVLEDAREQLKKILQRLEQKNRLGGDTAEAVFARISFSGSLADCRDCSLIIEAVVEQLQVKQSLFRELEKQISGDAILATNTSSLSVAAIASACQKPQRVIGAHFFNPAPLMPLVEIVPALTTAPDTVTETRRLINAWGKTTVIAKDTPGFIVNRVARPFYGEALRIHDEDISDLATIDWAMKEIGGFRMGPFELMDLIGNDINFTVTKTVFEAFYYDPRYRPSFTQQRMMEAGLLGRKSGRGYYDYSDDAAAPKPNENRQLGESIVNRVVAMLINEAVDALFWKVASREDIDLAMVKGVNYPKGLLKWADDIGPDVVLRRLENLQVEYGEDRYRPSPLLRQVVRENRRFW